MIKKNLKYIILFFIVIVLTLSSIVTVNAAIGKKSYAKNKYIWIYINDQRKILPSGYGYPCYGQGTDNKNILYIPLSVITDMCGCQVSPLEKQLNADGEYTYYAQVSGKKNFTVTLYSDEIDGIKLAGKTFILKGTDAAKTNVIMVPLGFAKDYFELETEVERPVGRGIYDYCSLAINIKGGIDDSSNVVLTPPTETGDDSSNNGSDTLYYVHAQDIFYHLGTCSSLQNDTLRAQLSEYECIHWGYTKCPICMGTGIPEATSFSLETPIVETPSDIINTEEIGSDENVVVDDNVYSE